MAETIPEVHERVYVRSCVKDVRSKVPKTVVIDRSNCGQHPAELNHAERYQDTVKCMAGLFFGYRASFPYRVFPRSFGADKVFLP